MNESDDDIRFDPEMGAASLWDVGSYCVSVMRGLAGAEPVAVHGVADFIKPGVDVSFAGTLVFPGDVLGCFSCSLRTEFGNTYDVFGTEGRLHVPCGVVPNPGSDVSIRHWQQYSPQDITVPGADQWGLVVEDFADALLTGRPPRVGPEEAVANLKVLDALMRCARG